MRTNDAHSVGIQHVPSHRQFAPETVNASARKLPNRTIKGSHVHVLGHRSCVPLTEAASLLD